MLTPPGESTRVQGMCLGRRRVVAAERGQVTADRVLQTENGEHLSTSNSPPSTTKKELRQLRAAERVKNAPRIKELKRRVETAERKIDELQKSLDTASEELFNPKPTTNFEELNRMVRTLQFEIDRYTADWEEAATELEGTVAGSGERTE